MTYCVGIKLNHGIVMMSDTRTNAGVDNISMFRKMFVWEEPGERVLTLMTAGNLATTQALISTIEERSKTPDERNPSILSAPTMFQVAKIVGQTLREVIADSTVGQQEGEDVFGATILLGGQIKGGNPCLFMIYPEGNFIEASSDTPYLQIGETKYGRPILVRTYDPDMSFDDAVKLLLVSFDSTVKANLSVAPPFDLMIYENESFAVTKRASIQANDPQYLVISEGWGDALKNAFETLPKINLGGF